MSVNDSHAGSRVIIKHAGRHTMKRKIFHSSSSCTFFIFCGLLNADISRRAQSLNGRRRGLESRGEERTREKKKTKEKEKSEQSNSRDLERRRYLPVQLRPQPHIQWALKALGLSQATVGLFIEWLPHSQPQTVHKKKKAMCARRASPA